MQALAQMPGESAAAVSIMLTDIDDTLPTGSRRPADAYIALKRQGQTGIPVMPVTGSPAVWCEPIGRMSPYVASARSGGGFIEMVELPLATRRHGQLGI